MYVFMINRESIEMEGRNIHILTIVSIGSHILKVQNTIFNCQITQDHIIPSWISNIISKRYSISTKMGTKKFAAN